MSARSFAASCLTLLALTLPARTAEPAGPPTLLVRMTSIEDMLDKAEYLAGLVGQEETARQFIGFARALAGDKGVEGIDVKRPFALYARVRPGVVHSQAVLLVPVADKESFLGLLKNRLRLEPKEDKGLYTLKLPQAPVPAYFRFSGNYLHLTAQNAGNVAEADLADPEKVIGKPDGLFDVRLRIDQIPDQFKKLALGQMETQLAEAKREKLGRGLKATAELRDRGVDSFGAGLKALLFEGRDLYARVAVDPKAGEISAEWSLTAKEGSDLAKQLADLNGRKALAGGWGSSGKALLGVLRVGLPESVRKALGPAVDEMMEESLDRTPADARPLAEKLYRALAPTFKLGEVDGGTALIGPDKDGRYTFLAAGKVEKGTSIEAAIREVVGGLPPEARDYIDIDGDKVDDTPLHGFKVANLLDDTYHRAFGDSPVWLAFGDDRVVVAFGPEAKSAIRDALKAPPAPAPLSAAEVSVARSAPLADPEKAVAVRAVAESLFGQDAKADRLTFRVEGGDTLKVRFAVNGKVLSFINALRSGEGAK